MLRVTLLSLALLGSGIGPPRGQTPADTLLTVFGFLHRADSGAWQLLLPEPVRAAGHRIVQLTVRARGDAAGWPKMAERYVEAVGRLSVPGDAPERAELTVARLREIEPPGATRNTVQLSFAQLAVVTLAAIPVRFGWRLPDGQPSGVQPLLMFSIYNHGQTELDVMLPTNDALCIRVRAEGASPDNGRGWHTTLPAPTRTGVRIVIRLGGLYRQFIPIPREAAPSAGRYRAHVALCGVPDYQVETAFEVVAP